MKYKNFLLSSSIIISAFSFEINPALSNNASSCASNCNERNCKANPKLASSCLTWCTGLPQYAAKLQACAAYATSVSAQPGVATPTQAPRVAAPTQAPRVVAPTQAPTTVTPAQVPTAVTPAQAPTAVTPTQAPAVAAGQQTIVAANSDMADKLARKKAKIAALKAQIAQLMAQLRAGGSRSGPITAEMSAKINDFKAVYPNVIPTRGPSGGLNPLIVLMQEIDNNSDTAAAEELLDYLESELGSTVPGRADSIISVLGSALPQIIKDVQAAREREEIENHLRQIVTEGTAHEAAETASIRTLVTTTPLANINPGSLLVLFSSSNFLALPDNNPGLIGQITASFRFMTLNQRKVVLKKMSGAVGNVVRAINEPGNARQTVFSNMYKSLNESSAFIPPRRAADRTSLESLNTQLIGMSGSGVVALSVPPAGGPSAGAGRSAGPPPPPPPFVARPGGPPPPPGPGPRRAAPRRAAPGVGGGALAAMVDVVPTDGVAPVIPGFVPPLSLPQNSNLNRVIRGLGYSQSQTTKIIRYMELHPGTPARTAVNTLIINADPLFPAGSMQPNT